MTKWQDDDAAYGRPGAVISQELKGEIEPWYFLVPTCEAMADVAGVLRDCCNCFLSVANGNEHDQRWHRSDQIRKPCTFHSVSLVES